MLTVKLQLHHLGQQQVAGGGGVIGGGRREGGGASRQLVSERVGWGWGVMMFVNTVTVLCTYIHSEGLLVLIQKVSW